MKKHTMVILCCFYFLFFLSVEENFANDNIFIDIGKNEKIQIIKKGKKEKEINAQKIINATANKIFKDVQHYQSMLEKASQIFSAIENKKVDIINGLSMERVITNTIGKPDQKSFSQDYKNMYDVLLYGKEIEKGNIDSIPFIVKIPTLESSLEKYNKQIESFSTVGAVVGGIGGFVGGGAVTVLLGATDGGLATWGGATVGASLGAQIVHSAGEWIGKKIAENPKNVFKAQFNGLQIWIYEKKFDKNLKNQELPKLSIFCYILSDLIPEFKSELQTVFTNKEISEIEKNIDCPNLLVYSIKSKFTSKEIFEIKNALKIELTNKKLSDLKEAIINEIKNLQK